MAVSEGTPVLDGYEVTWDGDGWAARPVGGGTVLRGHDQNALNAAHHRVLSAGLSRLRGTGPPDDST